MVVFLPVLTAFRAWLTVICPVTCMRTLVCGLVWICAAETTAVGTVLEFTATPFPWSFWDVPLAVEGLTIVTTRPVWPDVDMGTFVCDALVTVLPKLKANNKTQLKKYYLVTKTHRSSIMQF